MLAHTSLSSVAVCNCQSRNFAVRMGSNQSTSGMGLNSGKSKWRRLSKQFLCRGKRVSVASAADSMVSVDDEDVERNLLKAGAV